MMRNAALQLRLRHFSEISTFGWFEQRLFSAASFIKGNTADPSYTREGGGFYWTCMEHHLTMLLAPLIILINIFEDGAASGGGGGLTCSQGNHAYAGPREAIKVFHRRSACSCLKDLYYNLKDNTAKRTSEDILQWLPWNNQCKEYLRMRLQRGNLLLLRVCKKGLDEA
jgi:hypothetical protein